MSEQTIDDILRESWQSMDREAKPITAFLSYEIEAIRDGRKRNVRRPMWEASAGWQHSEHPWMNNEWQATFHDYTGKVDRVDGGPLGVIDVPHVWEQFVPCPFPREEERMEITPGLVIEIDHVAVQRVGYVDLERAIKSGVAWSYETTARHPFDGPVRAFLAWWDAAYGPQGFGTGTGRYVWDVDFSVVG